MIVVSGASGGIGRLIVPELAREEAVVALYNASELSEPIANVTARRVDLTDAEAIAALARSLPEQDARITLLSLAGKSIDALTPNVTAEQWRESFAVNCSAPFHLVQALAPRMLAAKWGRIILISSVAGSEGTVGTLAYSASKTALQGMSRVFSREFGRFGITSNVLELGYFGTGLCDSLSDDARREILRRIPSRGFGTAGDVLAAVRFLKAAAYVNGASIRIDGGL